MGTLVKNGVAYSGGSDGTTDYEDLSNLPSINGISLVGNKTSAELGIITKAVDDLVNYYTKSTTYSKSEVDDIVLAIKNSRFEAVSSLPTTNIKTNVIYLVPKSSPETSDVKDEYINLDGTTSGWELIGSTEIDLSNYVTVTALNTALADYTTTANLTTLLNAKQDKVQVSTMPTASADYVGRGFYQFMGVTDSTYTHGYFYECVNNSGTYSWSQVNVQPSSGGGSGGHTIKDEDSTAMTQRNNLQFGEAFNVSDDSTNNATVVEVNELASGDMDDIVFPLPSSPAVPAAAGFTPVGTVISVMGVNAPTHYLKCDGTAYNIVDYPELSTYFEQQFGSKNFFGGNGTTTFAVPDLRGEFLRGTGTNSHTNQGSGANVGVHQDGTEHSSALFVYGSNTIQFRLNTTSESLNIANQDSDAKLRTAVMSANASGSSASSNTPSSYTSRPTNTSVLYCIATKNIYLNPALDYSTDEKVVGKWIDGKPLYQKTVDCGALPNNTSKSVSHNISNIDKIINFIGTAIRNSDTVTIPLPYVNWDSYDVILECSSSVISLISRKDRSAFYGYVTIQYTKTTDQPNS